MTNEKRMEALRCRLCRRGLLQAYEVRRAAADSFGQIGAPVVCGTELGYFYRLSRQRPADVLEIAGQMNRTDGRMYRMLAFSGTARIGDLLSIGNNLFRVADCQTLLADGRLLTLEVTNEHAAY